LTGLILVGISAVSGARRRVARMEVPPGELVKRQWKQAKAAVSAGRDTWLDELAATRSVGGR
jgi:hypothetical protein